MNFLSFSSPSHSTTDLVCVSFPYSYVMSPCSVKQYCVALKNSSPSCSSYFTLSEPLMTATSHFDFSSEIKVRISASIGFLNEQMAYLTSRRKSAIDVEDTKSRGVFLFF